MRLALISLLMMSLALGCEDEGNCKEECADVAENCRDQGTPSVTCKNEQHKCEETCEKKADNAETTNEILNSRS
jgi:hypothetical protein